MFPRFLTVCALAVFVAVAHSGVEADPILPQTVDTAVQFKDEASPVSFNIVDDLVEILKDIFVEITTNCLKAAANECKKYWLRPKKLINCAKEYFSENEGDCAIAQ